MLSHLWVYLFISLTVTRILARLANSCHDFCLLKTRCWLLLLASLAFAVRLLQKNVSVLNNLGEQLLPQGFCLQFESMCLFCRHAVWHVLCNHPNLEWSIQLIFEFENHVFKDFHNTSAVPCASLCKSASRVQRVAWNWSHNPKKKTQSKQKYRYTACSGQEKLGRARRNFCLNIYKMIDDRTEQHEVPPCHPSFPQILS